MLYFAYGSNMDEARLQQRAPSARPVGIAQLDEYRLAFTRRSVRTRGGVADILSAQGFAVMGVAFEVDDADLDALDQAEGLRLSPPAYRRLTVSLRVHGMIGMHSAFAYQVVAPASREIAPRGSYLDEMLAGLNAARAADIAKTGTGESLQIKRLDHYRMFLVWLRQVAEVDSGEPGKQFVRPGLLMTHTNARVTGRNGPVAQLNSRTMADLPRHVVVRSDQLDAFAELIREDEVPAGCIALDQTLRTPLSLDGQLVLGHTVTVEPAKSRVPGGLPGLAR